MRVFLLKEKVIAVRFAKDVCKRPGYCRMARARALMIASHPLSTEPPPKYYEK